MVRRKKSDVYEELPPLVNADHHLVLSEENLAKYRQAEADVIEYFANRARELAGEDGDDAYWEKRLRLEPVENLIRLNLLRSVVAEAKKDAVLTWLDNFLEADDGKLIVFAEHIDMVETIYKRYSDISVKVRGDVNSEARFAARDKFQQDPSCRIFVANMKAAREGLTLTAASNVVFTELDWTPATHEQCIARCYARANDLHGATAWWLMVPDSVDTDMYELLEAKNLVINAVTDGTVIDRHGDGSVAGNLAVRLAKRGIGK